MQHDIIYSSIINFNGKKPNAAIDRPVISPSVDAHTRLIDESSEPVEFQNSSRSSNVTAFPCLCPCTTETRWPSSGLVKQRQRLSLPLHLRDSETVAVVRVKQWHRLSLPWPCIYATGTRGPLSRCGCGGGRAAVEPCSYAPCTGTMASCARVLVSLHCVG